MSTPEGKVKTAVKRALAKYRVFAHWPVQNGMGAPCLDCHGCCGGMYFAIETKAPGKKPTLRQEKTIDEILATGGVVFVISDAEGVAQLEVWLAMYSPGSLYTCE